MFDNQPEASTIVFAECAYKTIQSTSAMHASNLGVLDLDWRAQQV